MWIQKKGQIHLRMSMPRNCIDLSPIKESEFKSASSKFHKQTHSEQVQLTIGMLDVWLAKGKTHISRKKQY